MFKDYTHLENQIGSRDSIERQAYLHGKLTNYLNNINKLLGVKDLKEEYDRLTSKLMSVFENNKDHSPLEDEMAKLINVKTQYYNYSYKINRYDTSHTFCMQYNHGIEELDRHNLSLINNTLLEIAKKELYIEYHLNDTEEQKEKVKLQNTIIKCNSYITHNLANAELYNLSYHNAESNPAGFSHEVISTSGTIKTRPIIYVDKTWCTNVYDKNLHILEFEGARAFTLKCEWLEEDDEKCIYDTQVLQITGTRDEKLLANRSHYYYSSRDNSEAIRVLFKVKDLALSVSKDGRHWALGTTPAKAASTMRRRQKLTMLRTLNL
jgi:hypothetical protein